MNQECWLRPVAEPDAITSGGGLIKLRLLCFEGPGKPGHQLLHVGCLDRGAGPNAQARRGVAVVADVISDTFLFQQADQALGEIRLAVVVKGCDVLVDDLQARPRCWRPSQP